MAAKVNGIRKPSLWYLSRRPRSRPTAYTAATRNPVTMNAASSRWMLSGAVAGLNIARHGLTSVTFPSVRVKPRGWFIHAFAVTTKNDGKTKTVHVKLARRPASVS